MNQGYYNGGYNNNTNNANNPYYNQGMYNNRNYPPNPNNPYYMNGNRMNPNMQGQMPNNGNPNGQPVKQEKPKKVPRKDRPRKPTDLTNKKRSLLPLFIIVGILITLAVILLIVLLTRPREVDVTPTKPDNPTDYKVTAEQIVGTPDNGYVSIPVEWVVFEDSVTKDERMIQYSTPDAQYILTMDYYDKKIDNYSGANNMAIAMKKDGATNLKAAKVDIAGYTSYMVSGVYPDGVTLVAYFIQPEDGVTRCIMIEGPDPTNSAFNIPKTFQLTKDE